VAEEVRWHVKRLRELCEIEMGGTPDRANPAYWNGRNVWVSISDLSALDDKVIVDSREKITDAGVENSSGYPVAPGTLLLSFKLSIGKRAIAGVRLYTNEAIAALPIRDENEIDTLFLYYALGAIDWSDFGASSQRRYSK
jgi:type I restriction enzyme S subunit